MKHIFTLIAALSALICVILIALVAMTITSEKTFDLGQHGERTYAFKADSLEFVYQGKLTTYDERKGFKSTQSSFAGIDYDKFVREQSKDLPAATGFVLAVPALYPIALFAILPLVWLVGKLRKKSAKPGGFETATQDQASAPRA